MVQVNNMTTNLQFTNENITMLRKKTYFIIVYIAAQLEYIILRRFRVQFILNIDNISSEITSYDW